MLVRNIAKERVGTHGKDDVEYQQREKHRGGCLEGADDAGPDFFAVWHKSHDTQEAQETADEHDGKELDAATHNRLQQ